MRADLTYCDFLVLAPLQLEIDALEDALSGEGWTLSIVKTSEFPRLVEATITDSAVAHFQRHVVVVRLNYQGVLNASVDTARVLELYEPGYVVSFGIAGTLNSEDAPIGAVVFATSLFYYEPSKDKGKGTQSRMDPIKVGDSLLNPFRNLPLPRITRVDAPIASGEKLIADVDSGNRKRINAVNDKTLGVEMEAAGVGRAVNRLCPAAEFVVIKGISDSADKMKNLAKRRDQTRSRSTAAKNAATCLAQLTARAPLRRVFRSIPRPSEGLMTQTALREASQIAEALEPYGIKANETELYLCLYGRRGPIPAYFHWRQYSSALHWIDFKVLTALRALPNEIVTPVPLVTFAASDVRSDQPWHRSVAQLLGVSPTTDSQIREQHEELSNYFNRVGFTISAEREIRRELEIFQAPGRPEITLNLMRYMLGQFCHRRMFVLTWKNSGAKWMTSLSRAGSIWFSLLEWETMHLAQKDGKQSAPGKDLLIDPGSYSSLQDWLNTDPDLEVVQEFVDHFSVHQTLVCPPSGDSQPDARQQLKALMQCWDRVFFGLK